MTPIASSIKVQDLDHCGIVAGIIDSMGLVEQVMGLCLLVYDLAQRA
jgi:hypothetical protein